MADMNSTATKSAHTDAPFVHDGIALPSLFRNIEFVEWCRSVCDANIGCVEQAQRKHQVVETMERLGPKPKEWYEALHSFILICRTPPA